MPQECKLIIFDLDGVLVEAKQLHFDAFNDALRLVDPKFALSMEDHLLNFDGLPTTKKIEKLVLERGFPKNIEYEVSYNKQSFTREKMEKIPVDIKLCETFKNLKDKGYKLAVASNSVEFTVAKILTKLGILDKIDFLLGNDNVKNPKPNPEMYLKCMIEFGVAPSETLILEDSEVGRKAAIASGAKLMPINEITDVTLDNILHKINAFENPIIKWKDEKMNILIPMAGAGSRFQQAGYTFPKPLIEIHGKPMIQVVIENLGIDANYMFLCQYEHIEKYNLKYLLNLIAPNCEIIPVYGLTEGAACTTLLAEGYVKTKDPLLIVNSDQFLEWDSSNFMYTMTASKANGGIVTFPATHPKWSFAKIGPDGYITEVAEKKPISTDATVGVYYWKHGSDYVKYAKQMIQKDIRTNNEFYICPVYNEAIEDNKKIKNYSIEKMWGLGTPEDLEVYLDTHSR